MASLDITGFDQPTTMQLRAFGFNSFLDVFGNHHYLQSSGKLASFFSPLPAILRIH